MYWHAQYVVTYRKSDGSELALIYCRVEGNKFFSPQLPILRAREINECRQNL
jgi:hypothetical protein